jgi:hypothetical protein
MLILAAALAVAAGCGSEPTAAVLPPTPPDDDPCVERMHDLCGPLLLYRATRGRLPDRLEDLSKVAGLGEHLSFVCPVSGKPYVYNKAGEAVRGAGLVILRDPLPSHAGYRWAVAVKLLDAQDARVIALPPEAPVE